MASIAVACFTPTILHSQLLPSPSYVFSPTANFKICNNTNYLLQCHSVGKANSHVTSTVATYTKNSRQKRQGDSHENEIITFRKDGRIKEAVGIVHVTYRHGIDLDVNTYGSLLQACAKTKTLSDGKTIHAHIIKTGIEPDVFLENNLVNMYAKCGSMEDARQMFELMLKPDVVSYNTMIAGYANCGRIADARQLFVKMSKPDVVSWNAIIAAFVRNGDNQEALKLFQQMHWANMKPNSFTFGSVLKACASQATLQQGKQVHNWVIKTGLDSDVFAGSALVDMYSKCRSMEDAREVFEKMPERNRVSWTALITGYASNGPAEEALSLFHQVQRAGMKPSQFIFSSVLSACASISALGPAKEIHKHIIQTGFESDVFIGSALVDIYAKCGNIEDARNLFDKFPARNMVCWTAMITGYMQNGRGEEALKLFRQMRRTGMKPNQFTFTSITGACAGLAALEEGAQVHNQIIKTGYESDVFVCSALVDMYGKCGSIEYASKLFYRMPKNAVSWNAMISGFAQNGHGEEALKFFCQMQMEGIKPNEVTFPVVLSACTSLVALGQGMKIHNHTIKTGLEFNVFVGSALVDMYAKCGSIRNAYEVFTNMPKRNEVSWNAMMAGYAQHGRGKEALHLFEQMQQDGMTPNHITFISVLSACSHVGLVDEGRRYFKSMIRDYNIIPIQDHYACMVDLFARAGHLDEAKHIINEMPFEPGAVIWRTLLGACKIHGNMELAQHAAECILELEPQDAATYVLMSNIYAVAGRLDDAAKMRKLMDERGVNKEAGHSWIEVQNRVHTFIARDRSHPQIDEIYAKMEELTALMKMAGFEEPSSVGRLPVSPG
eukprot:Gb_22658 [translate_table: standard]